MAQPKLIREILEAALIALEQRKVTLDAQVAELRAMLPRGRTDDPAAISEADPPKGKRFGAATRRRMALAQKARWAKVRGVSAPARKAVKREPTSHKRTISAAARKAMSEASKRRWAAVRAAKTQQAKATAAKK